MNKEDKESTAQQAVPLKTLPEQGSAAVSATKQWLDEIIIGLNFCPFAKKEFVNNTIRYHQSTLEQVKPALAEFIEQCHYLQQHDDIETTLIIYSDGFRGFERYLDLVDYANDLLIDSGFEGIFQLATMHPEYCFADDDFDAASNFTNRSPYPMLHIIREASMARVLAVYKEPEKIPENNIALAEQKGSHFFQDVLKRIHQTHRPT
ncbi:MULTISPECIES: DUF1415 domain-containing protein [Colwellia]|uniref:DUF1415 domain-containing protein n=1 Tax=Colwellia marinimaniae TaxID=1513592 RepID=A0ABQ0MZG7_9GAMM|nr:MULTISPECIES: DUF1415 domain-containing protein [Colwellia]GAW97750.1 DUF1415 domain-containing protein [Colwellia marinimaniae]